MDADLYHLFVAFSAIFAGEAAICLFLTIHSIPENSYFITNMVTAISELANLKIKCIVNR